MKNYKDKWPALILVILGVFVLLGPYYDSKVSARDRDAYRDVKAFSEILDMVQKNYVEEVDSSTLIQGAINGMMRSLDPHSVYMTPDMFKNLEAETRGQFGGIGIEITIQNDVLTVISPIEDTPAFRAGVKPADQIIRIDGESTKDITIMEAVKKLRGERGTRVTITIMRENFPQPRDIPLMRAMVKIQSVRAGVIAPTIGYIRVASFNESTTEDLRKAYAVISARAPSLKGLVLDLRNDPGGLLDQAVEVSDLFLKSGVIVSTRGRAGGTDISRDASDRGNEINLPIVALVNEGTASAAEIVAGALQDHGRALIVGTRTFGKASVQTLLPMDGGAVLKLTTAHYYTPSGKLIHGAGIQPDIEVKPLTPQDNAPLIGQTDPDATGAFGPGRTRPQLPKSDPSNDSFDLEGDNQLKMAVEILKSWEIMKKQVAR